MTPQYRRERPGESEGCPEESAALVEHPGALHGWRRSVNDRRLPRRKSARRTL